MSKQLFYPVKYYRNPSKIDGKPYTTIVFEDLVTGDEYRTYVYSQCVNRTQWEEIIEKKDRDLLIHFEDLKIKDKKKRIIDADCKPMIYADEPQGALASVIREIRKDHIPLKPKIQPQGQFGKLFDIEE